MNLPAEADEAVALHFLDVALEDIDRRFENGEMDAFGAEGEQLAGDIARIRTSQMAVFMQHMTLEMSCSEVEPDPAQQARPAGQRYREAFEEKDSDVRELSQQLRGLSDMIADVNDRVGSAGAGLGAAGVGSPAGRAGRRR